MVGFGVVSEVPDWSHLQTKNPACAGQEGSCRSGIASAQIVEVQHAGADAERQRAAETLQAVAAGGANLGFVEFLFEGQVLFPHDCSPSAV